MQRAVCLAFLLSAALPAQPADRPPAPLASGLQQPRAVAVSADGKLYVAAGQAGTPDAGAILLLKAGKPVPFATTPEEARSLVAFQQWLFAAGPQRVWRITKEGKAETFAAPEAFPTKPRSLRGLAVDIESGVLYVADGGGGGDKAVLYRIDPKGKVSIVTDGKRTPALKSPGTLLLDGASHLLVLDGASGQLHRINLARGTATKVIDGLGGGDGLAWDWHGRLYVSDSKNNQVLVIPRPGDKAVRLAGGFRAPAGLCLEAGGQRILVADPTAGTVTALPAQVPGAEVDESLLPLETAVAFPDLKWAAWKPVNDAGQLVPLRPIVLTHAGDGSGRVFVAEQHGAIHVFPNDPKAAKSRLFLDIQARVRYSDKENEEGLLGLAFHPNYKKNGEFFVFYTDSKAKLTNVLSRFRVSRDDPDRADPASEEQLLRIERPFWNHDGGTLCFGPDGYLYVALGDGGSANDPFDNAQNLKTLLGSVLRLDVDHKDAGKKYAVPRDNPFVGRADARPEIWAYGLRNVWRMAFDRKTGQLWAGDVGQNLYEEIDILKAGGNYGWRRREGLHPFGADGSGPRPDLIDPIWEYHHDEGKSIIGGLVYRGRSLPQLQGYYLYGDYITGRVYALRYDEAKRRVTENRQIRSRGLPMLSFGEDEAGEAYLLMPTPSGQGILRFVPTRR